MKVIDSKFTHLIEGSYTSEVGTYYFFDGFIVSEPNEGSLINWEESLDIISIAKGYYGEDLPICYIANRVNKYSVKPTDWIKFFKNNNRLNGYAIVSYTDKGWANALIEKLFVRSKMQRFKNLGNAIDWAKEVNAEIMNINYSTGTHRLL